MEYQKKVENMRKYGTTSYKDSTINKTLQKKGTAAPSRNQDYPCWSRTGAPSIPSCRDYKLDSRKCSSKKIKRIEAEGGLDEVMKLLEKATSHRNKTVKNIGIKNSSTSIEFRGIYRTHKNELQNKNNENLVEYKGTAQVKPKTVEEAQQVENIKTNLDNEKPILDEVLQTVVTQDSCSLAEDDAKTAIVALLAAVEDLAEEIFEADDLLKAPPCKAKGTTVESDVIKGEKSLEEAPSQDGVTSAATRTSPVEGCLKLDANVMARLKSTLSRAGSRVQEFFQEPTVRDCLLVVATAGGMTLALANVDGILLVLRHYVFGYLPFDLFM